jgi:hypothetical protein
MLQGLCCEPTPARLRDVSSGPVMSRLLDGATYDTPGNPAMVAIMSWDDVLPVWNAAKYWSHVPVLSLCLRVRD